MAPSRAKLLILSVIVVLVSLFVRTEYILKTEVISPIRADAAQYVAIALNLHQKGIVSSDWKATESRPEKWPVGYPFFLCLIMKFSSSMDAFVRNTLFVQAVLGALTVLFAFHIGRMLMPLQWALLTAFLVAFSPHMMAISNFLLTETLFTFFLTAGAYLFLQAMNKQGLHFWLTAGILTGLAILTRPVLAVFPILAAGTALFVAESAVRKSRRYVLGIAGFLFFSYVFQGGWILWNDHAFKGSSSVAGETKTQLLSGAYPDLTYKNPSMRGMPYAEDPRYDEVLAGGYGAITREIADRFAKDPLTYIGWYLRKPVLYWSWKIFYNDGINIYPVRHTYFEENRVIDVLKSVLITLHPWIVLTALLGSAVTLYSVRYRSLKSEDRTCIFLLVLIVHMTLLFVVLTPMPRYALPLGPMMYTLFSYALYSLVLFFKEHRVRIALSEPTQ